ncbi:hypothetical protein GCM10020256_40700 [Streptomyces thermocoprophilus]
MEPHERHGVGAGGFSENDGEVFLSVGEAVEGDEIGVDAIAVTEAQRDPDAGALRGGGDDGSVGHAGPPECRTLLQI